MTCVRLSGRFLYSFSENKYNDESLTIHSSNKLDGFESAFGGTQHNDILYED